MSVAAVVIFFGVYTGIGGVSDCLDVSLFHCALLSLTLLSECHHLFTLMLLSCCSLAALLILVSFSLLCPCC